MKTKFFTQSSGCFRSVIDTAALERDVNQWLADHPTITVREIKHSMASGVWSYAQLVVAIYYTEANG